MTFSEWTPIIVGAAAVASVVGWPRLMSEVEKRQEQMSACRHTNRTRDGDRHSRTERCTDCDSQWPIKQVRCPKCRQWSDPDEV